MPEWEDVESTARRLHRLGPQAGQHVTGKVVDYSIDGGTDFNGKPCPQLAIELTEKAASFNKEGDRTDFEAGELVNSPRPSQPEVDDRAADPNPGDLVKITLDNILKAHQTAATSRSSRSRLPAAPA
jgi:hypothetical protein